MNSLDILERLIAFPTVSRDSNLALIEYVQSLLAPLGIVCERVPSADGRKASLLASTGPRDRPGILLSGHTDVVPVDGQDWTMPPFALTRVGDRFFGRGTADMKGFVASAIAAMMHASRQKLEVPLHLALSYDEEIGCVGVRGLIDHIGAHLPRPLFCLVGEPTGMTIATGHKGKRAAKVTCRGREGHSALAPMAVNAIHLACDLIAAIRAQQATLVESGMHDAEYEVRYSTLHVGTISAGTALNIVPNLCTFEFELRNVPGDDPDAIFSRLAAVAARITSEARLIAEESAVSIDIVNAYPGLDIDGTAPVVDLLKSLTGNTTTQKVAFGTEAGLYREVLGISTAICGPGFMAQGHRPDEFLDLVQLQSCDELLGKLVTLAADNTNQALDRFSPY